MKLLQMNVWGGRMVFGLPRFIRDQSADIVCMQEVISIPGETAGVFESLQTIQEECGFKNSFMANNFSYDYQNRTAEFGNAILSNTTLDTQDVVFVQGTYTQEYDDSETDGDHPRNFQHTTMTLNDKRIHVINFHGAFIQGSKDGNQDTVRHINKLLEYAAQFNDEPVIIAGDFNLAPTSESMRLLDNHYHNLVIEDGTASTYSNNLHVFEVVCDYIFVNDYIKVKSFDVVDTMVSDHCALILEFDV